MPPHLTPRGYCGFVRHLAAFVLGFLACTATVGRMAGADLDQVLAAKVLRVAMISSDAPPFVQRDASGAPTGLEGDFIAEVAKRMDVKLVFVRSALSPAGVISQVVQGQADVGVGQLTDSLEWAKSVRFTRPYLELVEFRLVDRLTATRHGGAAALLTDGTTRVTSVAGSVVLPAAQDEFGDRLMVQPTLGDAVDAVLAGRAAAAIGDDVAVQRWLDANPAAGLRLQLITRRDHPAGLAIAVGWKADDLQAWLNLCIEKCMLDGTLQTLASKYLGERRAGALK
jgi:ABC-type amino acid transport substrate-binding protein